MEINEAKAFYKKYLGQQFHMGREEWSKYQSFRNLGITEEQLAAWDSELFEEQLALLWDAPEQIWIRHDNLLTILLRGKCESEHLGGLLLDEMEKMTDLDEQNLILIIENMAGRDREMKTGGVYFYCSRTKLFQRMKACMEGILSSVPDNPVDGARIERAIERYREALQRFGR